MHLHALHPALPDWLAALDARFAALLDDEDPLLQQLLAPVLVTPGKRLRPLLVVLSAAAYGDLSPRVLDGAVLVELIHTASLAHDDVLDDAALRRGMPSAPARLGNTLAVLVGDYLVARAYQVAARLAEPTMQEQLAEVAVAMTRGVMLEMTRLDLDADEALYWQVVHGKTAALFGFAAATGALLQGAAPSDQSTLRAFGTAFGMAFQLADDLQDIQGCEADSGKPVHADWRQRRATLPLLYALRQAAPTEARALRACWDADPFTPAQHRTLHNLVAEADGFAYGWRMVQDYQTQASALLDALPATSGREALRQLCREAIPSPHPSMPACRP